MIRVIMIGGLRNSGKTEIISSIVREMKNNETAVVLNNERSLEMITSELKLKGSFPLTAPCGRGRQYSGRLEKIILNNPEIKYLITEPVGSCTEELAPLMNPLIAFKKDIVNVAPLFNVVDGRRIESSGVNKKMTDGLKMWQHIYESDVIIVTFSEQINDRDSVSRTIKNINENCKIIFYTPNFEGNKEVLDIILSDSAYSRALLN